MDTNIYYVHCIICITLFSLLFYFCFLNINWSIQYQNPSHQISNKADGKCQRPLAGRAQRTKTRAVQRQLSFSFFNLTFRNGCIRRLTAAVCTAQDVLLSRPTFVWCLASVLRGETSGFLCYITRIWRIYNCRVNILYPHLLWTSVYNNFWLDFPIWRLDFLCCVVPCVRNDFFQMCSDCGFYKTKMPRYWWIYITIWKRGLQTIHKDLRKRNWKTRKTITDNLFFHWNRMPRSVLKLNGNWWNKCLLWK
jgi:hypothetical protein